MAIQALSWALDQAPDVPAHCVGVLVGLANRASEDGAAAYPSIATLAKVARKSERSVINDLNSLAKLGLIRRGDQRHVAHIPPDRRPTVWDLALERRQDGGIIAMPLKPVSGKPAAPAVTNNFRPAPKGAALPPTGTQCPRHRGNLAKNCGPCKSEAKGAI